MLAIGKHYLRAAQTAFALPRTTRMLSTLRTKKYWIFDLDGTLTVPMHDFAAIKRTLGIPADKDILGYIAEQPVEVSTQMNAVLSAWEEEIAHQTLAAEGCKELLQHLHSKSLAIGVLTRNLKSHAKIALQKMEVHHFVQDADILGRHESRPKPDPEGIQKLMDKWGATREETVMIGDFRHDLAAGRAAGVATVHVDVGHGDWPELTDVRVLRLTEILLAVQADAS